MVLSGKFKVISSRKSEDGTRFIKLGDVDTFEKYTFIAPLGKEDFPSETGKLVDLKDVPVRVSAGKFGAMVTLL